MATLAVLPISQAMAALVIVVCQYALVLGKERCIGVPADRKTCAPEALLTAATVSSLHAATTLRRANTCSMHLRLKVQGSDKKEKNLGCDKECSLAGTSRACRT